MTFESKRTLSRTLLGSAAAMALGLSAHSAAANPSDYTVETVVEGLEHAWAIAFVPEDGRALVTERPGRLHVVDVETGETTEVSGVPDVDNRSQGGMLDVALDPDFASDPWVYLTYSAANDDGDTATYVGRGQLDPDSGALSDFEVIYAAEPYMDSTGHYGSRMVFDADGLLYVTTGDRQSKDFGPDHLSQDLTNDYGATLRLERDGGIPADNPFVDDDDARDAIFSYGHRNSQGMAVHPETGEIWQNEHGESNGDEVNVLQAGGNFGWPIATYGRDYRTGEEIGVLPHEDPDTVDPVLHWGESGDGFPPSGFAFYDGDAFPEWQGNAFMGNLAGQYLGRFEVNGHEIEETEQLLADRGWRIRDVVVGPDDGALYVLIDDGDAPLVRLTPEG